MSSIKTSSQFCLFCYKIFDDSTRTAVAAHDIKKFLTFLGRFSNCQNNEQEILSGSVCGISKFLNCCSSCKKIIKEYCEIYDKMKLLELQLDLKLNKLVEKINYANKVPTRWISLNKILEEFFQNDLGKQDDCQKFIRSFRQNIVKADEKRKLNSQPRVVLARIYQTRHPTSATKSDTAMVTECLGNQIYSKDNNINNESDIYSEMESLFKQKVHLNYRGEFDMHKFRTQYPDQKCPKCGKQLKSLRGLYVHLEHHKDPSEWKFECAKCGRKSATINNFRTHLRTHTGEKPFVCRFCSNEYSYKAGLILHLNECHKDEKGIEVELNKRWKWKSKENNFNFQTSKTVSKNISQKYKQRDLLRQKGSTQILCFQDKKYGEKGRPQFQRRSKSTKNENLNSNFVCRYCGFKYRYLRGLKHHLQEKHFDEDDVQDEISKNTKRKCDNKQTYLMVKKGSTKVLYYRNDGKRKSSKKYVLEDKPAVRIQNNKLNESITILENVDKMVDMEAEPNCENGSDRMDSILITDKEKQKNDKIDHKRRTKIKGPEIIKNDEKRFLCPKCGKGFANRAKVIIHLEYHKDPSEWSWECGLCGKKSATEFKLREHMRRHTNAKRRVNQKSRLGGKQFIGRGNSRDNLRLEDGNKKQVKTALESKQQKKSKTVSKNISEKYKQKDLLRQKGSTQVLRFQHEEYSEQIENKVGKTKLFVEEDAKKSNKGTKFTKLGPVCRFCGCTYKYNRGLKRHLRDKHIDEEGVKEELTKQNRKRCEYKEKYLLEEKGSTKILYLRDNWKTDIEEYSKEKDSKDGDITEGLEDTMSTGFMDPQIEIKLEYSTVSAENVSQHFTKTGNLSEKVISKKSTSSKRKQSLNFECKICTRKFTSAPRWETHFKGHHDLSRKTQRDIKTCNKFGCSAYFLYSYQLDSHIKLEHCKDKSIKQGSGVCGVDNNHKDRIDWKWECGLCGKKYSTEYKLRDHMIRHAKEKCRFVRKRFEVTGF